MDVELVVVKVDVEVFVVVCGYVELAIVVVDFELVVVEEDVVVVDVEVVVIVVDVRVFVVVCGYVELAIVVVDVELVVVEVVSEIQPDFFLHCDWSFSLNLHLKKRGYICNNMNLFLTTSTMRQVLSPSCRNSFPMSRTLSMSRTLPSRSLYMSRTLPIKSMPMSWSLPTSRNLLISWCSSSLTSSS